MQASLSCGQFPKTSISRPSTRFNGRSNIRAPVHPQASDLKLLRQTQLPGSCLGLDFETIGTAIPLFDGVRPYQQVPFQFSVHIVRAQGAEPEHHSFLADGTGDPRLALMRQLIECIDNQGSILAYNADFEKSRVRECCAVLPEFATWFAQLESRFVDLLKPFRAFNYYHPQQCGSNSMKAVLPALTARSYESLEIRDGGAANREFLRVNFGDVTDQERQRVRQNLVNYCGQDTEGMLWILAELGRIVKL